MSSRKRANKKFWKSVLILFAIYSVIVPAVFLLFDSTAVSRHFNKDPFDFVLKMAGIAFGIATIISLWLSRDPELRRW
jgi:hypothetical protein